MNKGWSLIRWIFLCLMAVIVVAGASCVGQQQEDEPTRVPTDEATAVATVETTTETLPSEEVEPLCLDELVETRPQADGSGAEVDSQMTRLCVGDYYLKDQIILSGPGDEIDALIDLNTLPFTLVATVDLNDIAGNIPIFEDHEVRLYLLPSGSDVWATVEQVYRLAWGDEPLAAEMAPLAVAAKPVSARQRAGHALLPEDIYEVFADPNYLTGAPIKGDPSNGQGGVGGNPGGGKTETSQALFHEQWAFQQIGFAADGNRGPGWTTGFGVEIALFDTSPYLSGETIHWIEPQFNLQVKDALATSPVTIRPSTLADDRSDHGLFGAGLAHHVAPQSSVSLIRVLNDTGQGDLFTLIQAMVTYLDEQEIGAGEFSPTAINLSLGMRPVWDDTPPDFQDYINRLRAELIAADPATTTPEEMEFYLKLLHGDALLSDPPSANDQELLDNYPPVPALRFTTLLSNDLGAVVVAAAGNDSSNNPSASPDDMQLPAKYPEVIGVAANNAGEQRACFSNEGDLSAPGGDGRTSPSASCQPDTVTSSCVTQEAIVYGSNVITEGGDPMAWDCPAAVVSIIEPVIDSPSEIAADEPSSYAYWIGTSFAAPLVSGLTALMLEANVSLTPSDVGQAITCGTPGIINVTTAVNAVTTPTPACWSP